MRARDQRNAAQEDAMQTRKEIRELRDEESLYPVRVGIRPGGHRNPDRNHRCQRVVNILHDWYNNRAGRDPKAMDKPEHGEKAIEVQKRIAVPRRQLLHYGQVDGR